MQLEPAEREVELTALELEVALGFATLTSSTSYYNHTGSGISDNSGVYARNGWFAFYGSSPRPIARAERFYDDSAFAQELRLVSAGSQRIDWTAGLYYTDQDYDLGQNSFLVGYIPYLNALNWYGLAPYSTNQDFLFRRSQKYEEWAAYGEVTFNATDDLHLTLGGRYFDNTVDVDAVVDVPIYSVFAPPGTASESIDDDGFLVKANVAWDVTDDSMLYATYSQGYRHAGANAVPTTGKYAENPDFFTFDSDSVDNYEIGYKGTTDRFNYSVSVYYTDWQDPQLNTATSNWGFFAAINGESARTQGIELELSGRLSDHMSYSLGYTYADAELTADVYQPAGNFYGGPLYNDRVAADGDRLPGTAEHVFNASLGYDTTFANGLALKAVISGYYQSDSLNAIGDDNCLTGFSASGACLDSAESGVGVLRAELDFLAQLCRDRQLPALEPERNSVAGRVECIVVRQERVQRGGDDGSLHVSRGWLEHLTGAELLRQQLARLHRAAADDRCGARLPVLSGGRIPHAGSMQQTREQLADTIVQLIDRGEIRRGIAVCRQLNDLYPTYGYGWYLASYLLKQSGNYRDALRTVDRALELARNDRFQLHKASCHFAAGELERAGAAIDEIRHKSFADAALHGDVASLLHQLGDHPGSLRHYASAARLEPGNAELHYNRGAIERYLGDAGAAELTFDEVIRIAPAHFEAYQARSNIRTQSRDRNHVDELRMVIERTHSAPGLVQLHYALAKELEDIGDYEASFESLRTGADLKRRQMQYTVETDLDIIGRIRSVYGPSLFGGRVAGHPATDPIFVIGMPRTGTTVVERILGSHSQVCAAGELNNFSAQLIRLVSRQAAPAPASRLDFVDASARLDFRALGEAYVASAAPFRDSRPRFIDKLPFNYLYAGLIHLALPNARIVNLKRHPLDTCYAVYKQLFRDAYPFSYDLSELGRYYIAYEHLMQHWNDVMPGVLLTLQYEDIVTDLEGSARRLLGHCGLPWEEQCLRFHENARPSTTASALQVRQPLYASSIGKWRNYARQLAPLREQLERAGIDTA